MKKNITLLLLSLCILSSEIISAKSTTSQTSSSTTTQSSSPILVNTAPTALTVAFYNSTNTKIGSNQLGSKAKMKIPTSATGIVITTSSSSWTPEMAIMPSTSYQIVATNGAYVVFPLK